MNKQMADADIEVIASASTGEGVVKLTPELWDELAKAAKETSDYFDTEAANTITPELAEFIRSLRVDQGYTWRAVARDVSEKTGLDHGSNQLWGMACCERAARFFSEDMYDGQWN